MDASVDNPIIWIGRFRGSSGYASATRGCFNALLRSKTPVIGVDIDSRELFGDIPSDLDIYNNKDNIEIRFKNRALTNVVIHECPDRWGQVEFHGLISLTGYTVAEIDTIPAEWQKNLPHPHRLWTASEFNKEIFSRHFGGHIDIVYHYVDVEGIDQSQGRLNLDRLANPFRVLHVVSNFNRKDTGSAIRAYVRAFSRRSDTTLVIKVPPKITESEIQKFFHDAVFPEVDLTDESLPHILVLSANLSDEEMWALYKQVDCTLVTERAKGFDLVSAEAMSAGCPAVAVGWGANLEFMTPQNSYLLKPQQELVPVDPTLIVNEQLYGTGMWSTFDIEDAAMALVDIHARRGAALERARRAQKDVQALLGRDNVARQMINSLRARRVWETAGFKEPRVRIWAKGRDRVTELSALRQLPFEKLNAEERALFKRSPKESAVDYIEKRRPLWGKYGCVLPPAAERERIRGLKDRHLGKSIFVMGNGPSLKLIDFDDLIGVPTFAANRISLAFDRTAWRPTFFTALDWLVSPDNHEEYDALPETITRFIPMRFHGLMAETPSTYWYESTSAGMHGAAKFQGDATQAIRGAGTVVTGMLQLAWHLGFRQFYLLGCNASYKVLDTVKQSGGDRFGTGVQVKLESTQDDDPNHFDPRYFGAGKKWHDPNVDEMMRGFRNCQLAIERMGGKLIDCTEGGKLEFLPRMRFEAALELVRTEGGI